MLCILLDLAYARSGCGSPHSNPNDISHSIVDTIVL